VSRRPGFTLLEMLVAMTLLAFIMVAGQQPIALAARAAAPHGDGGHGFLVRRQIADWLETAMPIRSDRRERSPLIFTGEPQALRFVTILPERFGTAGPHQSLWLGTVAFRRWRKAGRPKGEEHACSR
jgi:prepilin-type N-terminal cleavage/methylation domain-containing protein